MFNASLRLAQKKKTECQQTSCVSYNKHICVYCDTTSPVGRVEFNRRIILISVKRRMDFGTPEVMLPDHPNVSVLIYKLVLINDRYILYNLCLRKMSFLQTRVPNRTLVGISGITTTLWRRRYYNNYHTLWHFCVPQR